MHPVFQAFCWAFCLCLPTTLWAQAKTWSSDTLIYDWAVTHYEQDSIDLNFPRGSKHQLLLKADHTYTLDLPDAQLNESGRWIVRDEQLILLHELLPLASAIDSLQYHTEGATGSISMWQDEQHIVTLDPSGLNSARREETFSLTWQQNGLLTLTGGDRSIQLVGIVPLQRSTFQFLDILRGVLGLTVMLFVAWLFSVKRQAINWRLVGSGMALQLLIALLVLKVPQVGMIIQYIADGFVVSLGYSQAGAEFIFGELATNGALGYFAFQILPTIVFFSALMAVLYYLGILQQVVYAFAWLMSKTMKLSGAESLAAAGNIFVGQTEAPLLVRPYLDKMTKSEIMALMTGGFATIAGGVFAAYIKYLGGDDPTQQADFARHLLTASVMSAPAALVVAKILIPETEEINQDLTIPKDKVGANLLDALSIGIRDGLRLAVNVGVMLMVFTAIIALLNGILGGWLGSWTGLNDWVAGYTAGRYAEFNLQFILGLIGAPVAWLLGVPSEDALIIGQLLGEKTILNEFFAYGTLGQVKAAGAIVHYKSVVIATYALCGFANFASIGIQIGGIGALAPSRRVLLSQLGMRALLGGTLAAFLTAAIAGMLMFL